MNVPSRELTPEDVELIEFARAIVDANTDGEDGVHTRQMFVSENTVQDHLKSIFDKSSARSRRALLARALGT